MKSDALQINGRPIIQGRGLTPPGIVLLYIVGLALVQTLENFISGEPGRLTGIALIALFFLALKLGRRSALFTTVVTPPLALSATLFIATLFSKGFSISALLVGIVSSLARLAPWLLLTAVISWGYFFTVQRRTTKPSPQPSNPS